MVKASRPVNTAGDFVARQWRGENMREAVVFIHHLFDRHAAERADIERLSARGGIESGAVEINTRAIRARIGDASPEFFEVTVVVVEALGHGFVANCTV